MPKVGTSEEMVMQAAKIFFIEILKILESHADLHPIVYRPIIDNAIRDFNGMMAFTERYIKPYEQQLQSPDLTPLVVLLPGLTSEEFTPRLKKFCLFFLNVYNQCQKS